MYDWRKLLPRGHGIVGIAAPGELLPSGGGGGVGGSGGAAGEGIPAAARASMVQVFGEISGAEMAAALQAKVAEVTRGA